MPDSDTQGEGVGFEPGEPVGANQLPVGYQAVDLVAAHHLKELTQQRDALLGPGVAPFGHDTKEKRKGAAVVAPFDYRSGGQDEGDEGGQTGDASAV